LGHTGIAGIQQKESRTLVALLIGAESSVIKTSTTASLGNGNAEIFDAEWSAALMSEDARCLSYPSDHPLTQIELVEKVKADQVDRILERHNLSRGRVLEYACGTAGMSTYLANRGFDVVVTDLSMNAIRLARWNTALRSVPTKRFAASIGDVFHLPFADESFEVVMSYGLLEHFTENSLISLLRETNRVLRSGGIHIVDIIHGRWSIRTLATALNFSASALAHTARGRVNRVPELFNAYFDHYYENTLRPADWARLFRESGLSNIIVHTCRPFPLLALSGAAERVYIASLKTLLPLWRWFDDTDIPVINQLGWMYLVCGVKARE
jgi:ubiquinone/menaquinone biosynthesis C-methylase UbiE